RRHSPPGVSSPFARSGPVHEQRRGVLSLKPVSDTIGGRTVVVIAFTIDGRGTANQARKVKYEASSHLKQCTACLKTSRVSTSLAIAITPCLPHVRDLSFPKIISGRNGGASRTRLGWRQWRRTAGLPDPAACLCPRPSAYGPDCNTPHKKKEFAAGAIRQRSASGPSTRDARCQSNAPRTDFAKAIQARSVGRGCPSPSRVT